MKTKKQFEDYVGKVIKNFIPKLLLQQHTFKIEDDAESSGGYFACVFNYPYLNVTIKYSEKAFENWKNGQDQTEYIVHEMCHPITDPLYAKATSRWISHEDVKDEREKLTDYICNIVLNKYHSICKK